MIEDGEGTLESSGKVREEAEDMLDDMGLDTLSERSNDYDADARRRELGLSTLKPQLIAWHRM